MIDIIYPTFNRLEFTKESLKSLIANTAWDRVRQILLYDDGSEDGTREYLKSIEYPVYASFVFENFGGPVAAMNRYLQGSPTEIFAKIDNDAMVPPRWLEDGLQVINDCPELDLLGIDAFNEVDPVQQKRRFSHAPWIGGIGLMRSGAFRELPEAQGRYGFTGWQDRHKEIIKGWICPSIPFFLLDRIPFDPWKSLSAEYVAKGWQRQWESYSDNQSDQWKWWHK